jgi:hypothetical protein
MTGKDDIAQKGFSVLIDMARQDGKITPELAETLHRLRKMRNPYTHQTGGIKSHSYMGRLYQPEFIAPEDLVLEDAKFAVRAVVDYLRHGSPDWTPTKYQWNEQTDV